MYRSWNIFFIPWSCVLIPYWNWFYVCKGNHREVMRKIEEIFPLSFSCFKSRSYPSGTWPVMRQLGDGFLAVTSRWWRLRKPSYDRAMTAMWSPWRHGTSQKAHFFRHRDVTETQKTVIWRSPKLTYDCYMTDYGYEKPAYNRNMTTKNPIQWLL